MGKDSPPPPSAPDYTGAATATSQGSVQASLANNLGAHPNIFTPLGSQTWAQTGTSSVPSVGGTAGFDVPQYSQYINLSPEGQNLYSGQLNTQLGLMGLQGGALNRTAASLNQPLDTGSVQQTFQQAYNDQKARLDPQWLQNYNTQDTQLRNQGLVPGDEAYDNSMRTFNNAKTDAYQQADLSARQLMPQTFQLAAAERQQPLTELTSLMTGSQPQMPQFQPVQYSMGAQGPNMLGAAQAQGQYGQGLYNAQVGAQNAQTAGLFGLGAAALPLMA